MTPQVIVFDLGKVLVDFDYRIAARKIAARGKLPGDELQFLTAHEPLLLRYELGLLTSEQFYRAVSAATDYTGDFEEFSACFAGIFDPIAAMIDLHAALRQRGWPMYIFSNTNELAIRHIRRNFPFYSQFDGYILSYEHAAMKPDSKLYEVVERQSGRHGKGILYLDDRPENIAAGAARGWNAILHENPAKTRAALESLGLIDGAPLRPA